jgi:hypothetical protein
MSGQPDVCTMKTVISHASLFGNGIIPFRNISTNQTLQLTYLFVASTWQCCAEEDSR